MPTYTTAAMTPGTTTAGLPSMMVSTMDRDREGDVVVPQGCDARHFVKNPTLLFAHGGADSYRALPIGSVVQLDVLPNKGIKAAWKWLEHDPFADRVRNAWDQGVVRGASIGFQPITSTPNGKGFDHEAWQLLEISLCAIPANPFAVRTLKALGLYRGDDDVVLRLVDDEIVRIDRDDVKQIPVMVMTAVIDELVRAQVARRLRGR